MVGIIGQRAYHVNMNTHETLLNALLKAETLLLKPVDELVERENEMSMVDHVDDKMKGH